MIFSALMVVVPQGTARRLRIGHGPLTTEAMVPSGTETGETKINRIVETNELNDAELDTVCGGYAGQPTFYTMGGHIYAVFHNKSGRATGTKDLGEV